MRILLMLAGVGQLGLALGSLGLPRLLGWREEMARLRPLTREVFWTHAGYIWAINVSLGVLSAFAPGLLLDGSPLARALGGFIAAYWGVRLLVQFLYFDRSARPDGLGYRIAEAALVMLFLALTGIYARLALGPV